MKNLKFADDKIWIEYINKKTLLSEGTTTILYQDIVDLFEVKSRNHLYIIGFSIFLIALGFYLWDDFGLFLCCLGIPFLVFGLKLSSSYLGIRNNKGDIYWVNVNEYKTEDLINLIEDYRRNLD